MLIVGERISTSRKRIDAAAANRDAQTIQEEVGAQIKAGADLIDINAGSRLNSEANDLLWLIDVIQAAFSRVRLCIDSPNPESMKVVLNRVINVPMLNSITAERSRFEVMAPFIQIRECDVVALCVDDRGLPQSSDHAVENSFRLVSKLQSLGVARERIYLDPVIQAVSTHTNAALKVLETIERIHNALEGVNIICGLSNISFGLPVRPLINRAFLSLAMKAGLNAAILDPLDSVLMGTLRATHVLLDQDLRCQA